MTEVTGKKPLEGDDAINLWLQEGKAWNEEITKYSSVDFSGVDFNQYRNQVPHGIISFYGFKFPNDSVDFRCATFGVGDVSFEKAVFGDGGINFVGAIFGDGRVSFEGVTFGDGSVGFFHTTFGNGDVNFRDAKFGKGKVDFRLTTFGKCKVDFRRVRFGDGPVYFTGATFGKGDVVFDYAKCGGPFNFSPEEASQVKRLSFYGCTFKGVMILNGTYTCVPDLRNTITSSHVDLSGLKIKYNRFAWIKKLGDKMLGWIKSLPWIKQMGQKLKDKAEKKQQDAAQFCRLKELAEQNRAHDKALDFFADECRVERSLGRPLRSFLDVVYAFTCRHGRSIGRPVIGLVGSWFAFSWVYASLLPWLRPVICSEYSYVHGYEDPKFWDAFLLNIFNSVPFLGFTRYRYEKIFEGVFGLNPSLLDYMTIGLQSLIAFIFLFLIGLGIRNRFRI